MKALIVEDDALVAGFVEDLLQEQGLDTVWVSTEWEAIEAVRQNEFRFATFDVDLGNGGSGYVACREIRKIRPMPIMFITGNATILAGTPYVVIGKPFTPEDFATAYKRALTNLDAD